MKLNGKVAIVTGGGQGLGQGIVRCLAEEGENAVIRPEHIAEQVPSIELDRTLTRLSQHELVEAVEGGYRFQVELIRRWFAQVDEIALTDSPHIPL